MSSERIEPDGELESFLYVIAGTLRVVADSDTHVLAGAGRFAYVGVDDGFPSTGQPARRSCGSAGPGYPRR